MSGRVPLTEFHIKGYLDRCIEYWIDKSAKLKKRERLNDEDIIKAEVYIEAYQAIRISLFGEKFIKKERKSEELPRRIS